MFTASEVHCPVGKCTHCNGVHCFKVSQFSSLVLSLLELDLGVRWVAKPCRLSIYLPQVKGGNSLKAFTGPSCFLIVGTKVPQFSASMNCEKYGRENISVQGRLAV